MGLPSLIVKYERTVGRMEWLWQPAGQDPPGSREGLVRRIVEISGPEFDGVLREFHAAWDGLCRAAGQAACDPAPLRKRLRVAAGALRSRLCPPDFNAADLGAAGSVLRVSVSPDAIPLEVLPVRAWATAYEPIGVRFRLLFSKFRKAPEDEDPARPDLPAETHPPDPPSPPRAVATLMGDILASGEARARHRAAIATSLKRLYASPRFLAQPLPPRRCGAGDFRL